MALRPVTATIYGVMALIAIVILSALAFLARGSFELYPEDADDAALRLVTAIFAACFAVVELLLWRLARKWRHRRHWPIRRLS